MVERRDVYAVVVGGVPKVVFEKDKRAQAYVRALPAPYDPSQTRIFKTTLILEDPDRILEGKLPVTMNRLALSD